VYLQAGRQREKDALSARMWWDAGCSRQRGINGRAAIASTVAAERKERGRERRSDGWRAPPGPGKRQGAVRQISVEGRKLVVARQRALPVHPQLAVGVIADADDEARACTTRAVHQIPLRLLAEGTVQSLRKLDSPMLFLSQCSADS
jgi:hypothetical protein